MSLLVLLKKEARVILRSRLLLLVLVLYPLVIVGIIGYAFSAPNQLIPVAVVNEDVDAQGNPNSENITNPVAGGATTVRISTTEIIDQLRPFAEIRVTTLAEGRRQLLTGDVQAVVRFPQNFVRDIARFDSSGLVEITIDQSDPVRANFTQTLIRGVVQEFQERVVRQKVDLVVQAIDDSIPELSDETSSLYPGFTGTLRRLKDIRAEDTTLSDEHKRYLDEAIVFLESIVDTLERSSDIVNSVAEPVQVRIAQEKSGSLFIRDLVVPAALGLSIFWTGSLATSSLVVYERESAAYTRLRITPASAASIYGSKILLTLGIILGQSLLILIAAIVAWDTRIDNPALTFLVILMSTFASIGLGLFLSGVSRDVNGTILLSVLFTFPMLFLAGLFYPVSFMPRGAQILAGFFPLTYTVSGLRGSMLRGFDFAVAQNHLLILAAFGLGLSIAGILLGRRLEGRR